MSRVVILPQIQLMVKNSLNFFELFQYLILSFFKDFQGHVLNYHFLDSFFETKCCHPNCEQTFTSLKRYLKHLQSDHIDKNPKIIVKYKCNEPLCQSVFTDVNEFFKDFYNHIRWSIAMKDFGKVDCLYKNCDHISKGPNKCKAIQSHFNKYHSCIRDYRFLKGKFKFAKFLVLKFSTITLPYDIDLS